MRKTLRIGIVAVMLAGLAILLTQPGAALAASWTYTTDFDGYPVGWQDLTAACGSTLSQDGTNYRPSTIAAYGDGSVLSAQYGRKLVAYFELDEPVTITHVGLIADMGSADSGSNYVEIVACEEDRITTHYVADGDSSLVTLDETVSWPDVLSIMIYSAPASSAGLSLITAESGYTTTAPYHYPWVDAFTISADAATDPFDGVGGSGAGNDQYRPVRTLDTLEVFEDVEAGYSYITAYDGADVFAAINGVVTLIQPGGGGSTVHVENETLEADYFNLAVVYAQVGDAVEAGCVLGQAGEQFTVTQTDYAPVPVSQITFRLTDGVDSLDWQSFPDPPSKPACGDHLRTSNCLNNNPNLDDDARLWTTDGAAGDGTVTLDPGESLVQQIVLTAGVDYYLIMIGTTYGSSFNNIGLPSTFAATLGDASDEVTIQPKSNEEMMLVDFVNPLTPTIPDTPPDIYDLAISPADGSNPILITFACLHEGNVLVTPDACYLTNAEFGLYGTDGWDLSEGASFNDVARYVRLQQDEWMSQPIDLSSYDGADADYYIRVQAVTSDQDLDPITDFVDWVSGDYIANLDATYEVDSVVVETLAQWDINNIIVFWEYQEIFTVPDGQSFTGDLVLTNATVTPATRMIDLRLACITPVSGIWPGYEDPDSGPVIERKCSSCTPPRSLAVVAWIEYLICVFRNLWTCTIAALLNRILAALVAVRTGLGYFGRYVAALLLRLAAFVALVAASGLQALLNGVALLFTAAWAALAALGVTQSAWDILSLGALMMGVLATAIDTLLGLLVQIVSFTVVLVGVVTTSWAAIVAAINGAMAPEVGLPNCGNPSDPLIGLCYGLNAVTAIIAEFPALVASTYVMAGSLGIYTIVWTIRVVGKTFGDV